jgi:hypothetical protein
MSQPASGQLTVPGVPPAAQDPDYGKWGFAQTPSLRDLQHSSQAQQEQGQHATSSPGHDPEGWLASIHSSRVFACPYSLDAMGKALGLTEVLTALSGTLATPAASPSQAAAAVEVVHNAIDISWSGEALRRGVAAAKSGKQRGGLSCAMLYDLGRQFHGSSLSTWSCGEHDCSAVWVGWGGVGWGVLLRFLLGVGPSAYAGGTAGFNVAGVVSGAACMVVHGVPVATANLMYSTASRWHLFHPQLPFYARTCRLWC